jgi:hypothetical protein
MLAVRSAQNRGAVRNTWLDSRHTFSFGNYYDPNHMGFGVLRVINEDWIAPNQGFGTHGHQDMEIITYVLAGELAHKDSLGNGSRMRYGDVQRMSAGTGIQHSEFNPSVQETVHLLQIWILPAQAGLPPSYEQTTFAEEAKQDRLCLIGSPDGREGSVTIHQDVHLYAAQLSNQTTVSHSLAPGRSAWLHVAQGKVSLNGQPLAAGDGVAITQTDTLHLKGLGAEVNELLLFDMGH